MPEVVTIIGHHRFAKTILAIKRVRVHAGWTLHPAKKAIDRARANERVEVPVPTEAARTALMSDLSELGWSTESGSISKEARTPDAPDWWLRVKGLSRVVEHRPTRGGQGRIRLALRDCSIEPGDTVGWVMHENLVLSIGIDPDSLTRGEPMALIESKDMEDPELAPDSIRQLYPLGMDLEVFAPEPLLWPVEWRLAREQLWSAVSHLPTELKSNPEGGSLEQYREWLDHNELGLAYEELVGLAEVNPVPTGFHEAMGEAARLMGLESTMDGPGLVAVQDKA